MTDPRRDQSCSAPAPEVEPNNPATGSGRVAFDPVDCACPCEGCSHWCAGHPDRARCLGRQFAEILGDEAAYGTISRLLTAADAHVAAATATPDATVPDPVACDGCGDELTHAELTHQCVPCGARAAVAEDIIAAADTQAAPLRERLNAVITATLRASAYSCDGNCGLDEADCIGEHPVQVTAWSHGAVSDVDGPVDAIAGLLTPAILAAIQGRFAPPPRCSTAEQLPAELLALIERAPYLSTACDAAQRLESAAGREASYIEDRVIDQLGAHAGKLHQRCRLNNKFTGQRCRCACHREAGRG